MSPGRIEREGDAAERGGPARPQGGGGLLERRVELAEAGQRGAGHQRNAADEVGEREDQEGADQHEAPGPGLVRAEGGGERDGEHRPRERPGKDHQRAEQTPPAEAPPHQQVGGGEGEHHVRQRRDRPPSGASSSPARTSPAPRRASGSSASEYSGGTNCVVQRPLRDEGDEQHRGVREQEEADEAPGHRREPDPRPAARGSRRATGAGPLPRPRVLARRLVALQHREEEEARPPPGPPSPPPRSPGPRSACSRRSGW